jgi:hypothetical protein
VRTESSVRLTYAIAWQAVLNAVFPEIFKFLSARVHCRRCISVLQLFFLRRFIAPRVYTVCTRISYKIVSVTNLNKYFHYFTSGTVC